jgi:hypothetical protein
MQTTPPAGSRIRLTAPVPYVPSWPWQLTVGVVVVQGDYQMHNSVLARVEAPGRRPTLFCLELGGIALDLDDDDNAPQS